MYILTVKENYEISHKKGRKSLIDIETFSKSKSDAKIVETFIIKITKCFKDRRKRENELKKIAKVYLTKEKNR